MEICNTHECNVSNGRVNEKRRGNDIATAIFLAKDKIALVNFLLLLMGYPCIIKSLLCVTSHHCCSNLTRNPADPLPSTCSNWSRSRLHVNIEILSRFLAKIPKHLRFDN
ncbi:hypothetical protein ACH5RR_013324 [Cinchona calisaya]|uniref:Uncharacterized protein n=1 Tax=Cinchona calisaya TaxID=153742 RepID=A0ABD2ZZT9_9GENT